MPIGALKHRLTFLSPLRAQDAGGGATETWVSAFTVWGAVSAVSADEQEAYARESNVQEFDARVRKNSRITAEMRVRWRGAEYDITSVGPVGLDDYQTIRLQTVVD